MLRNYYVIFLGMGTGFEETSDSVWLPQNPLSLALES